ncbi:hypothetical protein STCU_04322 [Strigomonas culicis]|uniref:Uncharacterized protein n=1 Tax=Strigomonas culicis TaxID=28005 RepID=S9UGH2_9TRYP|nr:hypothetical protein STCU_04322 [Strigomonas culicis]|eukprot:EPY29927.1 hypothetical protein STCU_04322 [Strigomonas culicis]
MEYEQLEKGSAIISAAILSQDVANYSTILHPQVLLVSHFPYPDTGRTVSAISDAIRLERASIAPEKQKKAQLQALDERLAEQQRHYEGGMTPAPDAAAPPAPAATKPKAKTAKAPAPAPAAAPSTAARDLRGVRYYMEGQGKEPPAPYGERVSLAEGPLLVTERLCIILNWLAQGKYIADTKAHLGAAEARPTGRRGAAAAGRADDGGGALRDAGPAAHGPQPAAELPHRHLRPREPALPRRVLLRGRAHRDDPPAAGAAGGDVGAAAAQPARARAAAAPREDPAQRGGVLRRHRPDAHRRGELHLAAAGLLLQTGAGPAGPAADGAGERPAAPAAAGAARGGLALRPGRLPQPGERSQRAKPDRGEPHHDQGEEQEGRGGGLRVRDG